MNKSTALLASLCLLLFLGGCATPGFAPQLRMADAKINPETVTGHALRWLPSADQKIPIAVYGISDQTGAFKPSEGGQTLSRAVTQAPTPILIKALQDAGNRTWFSVIERENLSNLIKERQIIQEMRQRYLGETELNRAALPALKFAGILIEGAITGYDTNTRTGGLGARYLGIGGFTQYREDSVSLYLRAVSVKTGEVLASISTQQRVASVGVQGDAFRFVSFQKLLEAEAGVTFNQPRHLAVQQALEKAVYGLIVEGAETGLWTFNDPVAGNVAINHYRTNYAPAAYASMDGGLPPEFYASHRPARPEYAALPQAAPPRAVAQQAPVDQEAYAPTTASLSNAPATTQVAPQTVAQPLETPETHAAKNNEEIPAQPKLVAVVNRTHEEARRVALEAAAKQAEADIVHAKAESAPQAESLPEEGRVLTVAEVASAVASTKAKQAETGLATSNTAPTEPQPSATQLQVSLPDLQGALAGVVAASSNDILSSASGLATELIANQLGGGNP